MKRILVNSNWGKLIGIQTGEWSDTSRKDYGGRIQTSRQEGKGIIWIIDSNREKYKGRGFK